jgi:hypothetical protein
MARPALRSFPVKNSMTTTLLALATAFLIALPISAAAQDSGNNNNSFDVRSTVGDMHLGADAKPGDAGLPVYPHARLKQEEGSKDKNSANLSIFTSAFGIKLVVLNYVSDDPADKIVAYYKDQLKRYGKVLECHTDGDGSKVDMDDHDKDDSHASKELKCDGDNQGRNIELKVGTEDNQHVVSVEPNKSGSGATFALVYVHARGKQGDI